MCQKINEELVKKMEERLKRVFQEKDFFIDDQDGVHLKVEVVSDKFQGLNLVQRHQMVYKALDDLLMSGELHSVKLVTTLP